MVFINGKDGGKGVLKLLCLIIIGIDLVQATEGGSDDAAIWCHEKRLTQLFPRFGGTAGSRDLLHIHTVRV